ncbi:MAG: YvcK family protein [Candidatus Levybacteria bacterium]|nr:YvcK family protein [Candidatus Levybacteria bacterium]
MHDKKIVCLGGGIGTVNLVKGLKTYTKQLTVIVSTADDGGSAGRLRRLYNVPPPGDIVSCIAALSQKERAFSNLLTYRFPGNRYGSDDVISGHKLGNLMLVAAWKSTRNVANGVRLLQALFQSQGTILPATTENITLSAKTVDGVVVKSEKNIDLGEYNGQRVLDRVFIHPKNPDVSRDVISAFHKADCIIAGPGDLYTTILPVLIIPKIKALILETNMPKFFIVNVANKPFETKGYAVSDFIKAIEKHLGSFPFHKIVVNNNFAFPIPKKYKYTYVTLSENANNKGNTPYECLTSDLIDESFPLHHDAIKLASFIRKMLE